MPELISERRVDNLQADQVALKATVVPLPEARLGLIIAAVLFFADVAGKVTAEFGLTMFRFLALILGVFYWLHCVYRLHKIIREIEPDYPISPEAAVGWHFPPFFSLYWIFKWPIEFSKFINRRGFTKIVPGGWVGLLLFACVTVGQAYWGAGLAAIFLVTWYLTDKLSYEVRYHDVFPHEVGEPPTERIVGAIMAGNAVNYLTANTGFVLLLVLFEKNARPVFALPVFALIFIVSGLLAGVAAGNIGHRGGLALGVPANIAVLGSVLVGLYVVRQHDLPVFYYTVIPALAGVSFAASVVGTGIGMARHQENHYAHVWSIVHESSDRVVREARVEEEEDLVSLPAKAASPAEARIFGGMAFGNLVGGTILLFYRYPAAFIEFVWGDQIYTVSRLADMLVIVTGAFIAAYVGVLIAKDKWRLIGIGANFIMYITIFALFVRAFTSGDFLVEFFRVLPMIPVVAVAGLLGGRAADNNLRA